MFPLETVETWYFTTWLAPVTVLVLGWWHHSVITGAVFQRCWSVVEVGIIEYMLYAPRQSARSPIFGDSAIAWSTPCWFIALITTCCFGKASNTELMIPRVEALVAAAPSPSVCHSPYLP